MGAPAVRNLDIKVTFIPQPSQDFVDSLTAKGMSEHATRGVLQLWQEIDAGRDLQANPTFAHILGHRPTTAEQWTRDHACCFHGSPDATCGHPRPPYDHMF